MKTRTKIISLFRPFLFGFVLFSLLTALGYLIFGILSDMNGWSSFRHSLFGGLIFNYQVQADGSHQMTFGPGVLFIGLLGGLTNMGLAWLLNRKESHSV
ncbi:hypothetical protein GCM10007416_07610 [Kroppenstedtia guangzhouensis]|uniref:Uncharacterized protein n=1 Tax=Kroppenstedtia guangzhouensis TaxID=1274356 RepID=A0ABQ1G5F1_9BACL|nr:hypothetical protein [Kroppenstedtia guangzhouensis]GGA37182.1 hypothetical protein GCM10007416_07610 [Kroppenstedtia guangzhouensis]